MFARIIVSNHSTDSTNNTYLFGPKESTMYFSDAVNELVSLSIDIVVE